MCFFRFLFNAIVFFAIGVAVGLYLPSTPQYAHYADKVTSLLSSHKTPVEKAAENPSDLHPEGKEGKDHSKPR